MNAGPAIAARIRKILKDNGWSESELNRRAGFETRSQLNGILKTLENSGNVEISTLDVIAKGAGVSPLWLQYGDEVPAEGTVWRRIEGWDAAVDELFRRAPTIPPQIIEDLARTHGTWAPNPMNWEWLLIQANHALKAMPDEKRLRLMDARMTEIIETQLRKDQTQKHAKEPVEPPLPGISTAPTKKTTKKSEKPQAKKR